MLNNKDKLLISLSLLPRVGRQLIKDIFTSTGLVERPADDFLAKLLNEKNHSSLQSYFNGNGWLVDRLTIVEQLLIEHDIDFINYTDPGYPDCLRQIPDYPVFLFYKGNIDVISLPQIAIVGSRKASSSSLRHAYNFAQSLALNGFVITSGLAQGIDSAAHSGVVDIQHKTIAVMGTGLDRVYPVQHKKLAEKVLEHGCWLSEYLPGMRPIASNFPRRNRIISGLSLGVLIVEARVKSGTLITARMAIEQNREVFAIPGPIEYAGSEGCHSLIKDGAKLVHNVDDVLSELTIVPSSVSLFCLPESIELQQPLKDVLQYIDFTQLSLQQVSLNSHIGIQQLSVLVVELELLGWVESIGSDVRRIK